MLNKAGGSWNVQQTSNQQQASVCNMWALKWDTLLSQAQETHVKTTTKNVAVDVAHA